ncbi:hypothetical protein COO60DRAFT_1546118 [Scenedesmus sp. NREL 46B-D3]|nr:hypothetical protein COO60DRAFT_1546118 [Scenedesmus sp. NREL 46B-D3]
MYLSARSPTAQLAANTRLQHSNRVICAARSVLSLLPAAPSRSNAATRTAHTTHKSAGTSHTARKRRVACNYSTTYEQYTDTDYGGSDNEDYDEDSSEEEKVCDDSDSEDEGECYAVHHVHQRLPLTAAALGDSGTYVVSYEDGNIAWSEGLSDVLYNVLQTSVRYKKDVVGVAMGRNQGSDTYQTAEDPGDVRWVARGVAGDDRVVDVSFAPNGGWYVRKEGGSCCWNGLPASLEDYLQKYWDEHDGVKELSVGHNGEYFVLFGSRAYGYCGVHPTLVKLLSSKPGSRLRERTGDVQWVELGPAGTFIALFERYTAWYGSEDLADALLGAF